MTDYTIQPDDALMIIDPQNDFCPGGKLAVVDGDIIMAEITRLAERFTNIVVTQDYHPADHKSFASNHEAAQPFSVIEMPYGEQVLWPDHCIQGTEGAEFHLEILPAVARANMIIRKGMNPNVDSYSGFYENDKITSTGLGGYLRDRQIKRIFVVGLAYDYCVGYTAIDGFKTVEQSIVVKDLTRAIGLNGSTETIENQFRETGVTVINFADIAQ